MTAAVYVGTSSARPGVKVGFTVNPSRRARDIGVEIAADFAIVRMRMTGNAADVEAMAHWQLRDHHLGGEWFDVSVDTADLAVCSAIGAVDRGERAPRRIGCSIPFHVERKKVRLQLVIDDALVCHLDDWRRDQADVPNRSEAIRRLIMKTVDVTDNRAELPAN